MPFSEDLRKALWTVHENAESTSYLDALMNGSLTVEGFGALAAQRYFIYSAMEAAADRLRDHPVCGPFFFDELSRLPLVSEDLVFYQGDDWRSKIEPYPETEAYYGRAVEMAEQWPEGFVGHYYVRYLGDLSGGQVFRDCMLEHHNLRGPGIRFYDFDDVPDVGEFRAKYRTLLDTAEWTDGPKVIEEAVHSFALNNAVFRALGERVLV